MNLPAIRAMSTVAVAKVRRLEQVIRQYPQARIVTHHLIHAGMYHRTIKIPAGMYMTGALIKIPTTLTVSGDVTLTVGEDVARLTGYHVIPAAAHRKTAFFARADTWLTMSFATSAKDVTSAEREFTDEPLLSHENENVVNITGEL